MEKIKLTSFSNTNKCFKLSFWCGGTSHIKLDVCAHSRYTFCEMHQENAAVNLCQNSDYINFFLKMLKVFLLSNKNVFKKHNAVRVMPSQHPTQSTFWIIIYHSLKFIQEVFGLLSDNKVKENKKFWHAVFDSSILVMWTDDYWSTWIPTPLIVINSPNVRPI